MLLVILHPVHHTKETVCFYLENSPYKKNWKSVVRKEISFRNQRTLLLHFQYDNKIHCNISAITKSMQPEKRLNILNYFLTNI
jgi:hypothetical protein